MSQNLMTELLKRNPKVNVGLLDSFKKNQEKLPESAKQKHGSSFHLEHPFAGQTIMSARKEQI